MEDAKKWFKSKLVWAGIFQTLLGVFGLLAEFFSKGDFSVASAMLLASGVVIVIMRVWFTDTPIQK